MCLWCRAVLSWSGGRQLFLSLSAPLRNQSFLVLREDMEKPSMVGFSSAWDLGRVGCCRSGWLVVGRCGVVCLAGLFGCRAECWVRSIILYLHYSAEPVQDD